MRRVKVSEIRMSRDESKQLERDDWVKNHHLDRSHRQVNARDVCHFAPPIGEDDLSKDRSRGIE